MENQELNPRQTRFCEEYLKDLNGTQAAIRAGYSESTAKEIASENLTKPHIAAYLAKRQKELQEVTGITQKRVLEELASIGFARITDYLEVKEAETDKLPAIDSGEDDEYGLPKLEKNKFKLVDIFTTKDVDQKAVGAISAIKQGSNGIEIKLHDKAKALELLGKHLGIFEKDNEQKKYTGPTIMLPDNQRGDITDDQ